MSAPVLLPCAECDADMAKRATRIWFEGDYSITTQRWECQGTGCLTSATVEWRTFIPVDVARMRPDAP